MQTRTPTTVLAHTLLLRMWIAMATASSRLTALENVVDPILCRRVRRLWWNGIPAGDCDCDGNQLDALGVCGGSCIADADADGICDDADDCVGSLDACGVCNGPGAIYACGCSDIPAGDCDCDGNVLDACGVCGGSGVDADADGICDDIDECVGQLDECGVCNGDGSSCADPCCAAAAQSSPYTLTVESVAPAAGAPGTVYRFYVNAMDDSDKLSAVFGNDQAHLIINTPDGIFKPSQHQRGWNGTSRYQPCVRGGVPRTGR